METFIPNSFQVPNALVDLFLLKLTEFELKIYLIIIRKTKGWNKDFDAISISQFIKILEVKDQRTVKKAIKGLAEKNLIIRLEQIGKESKFAINLNPLHANEGSHPNAPTSRCTPQSTINEKQVCKRKKEPKILNVQKTPNTLIVTYPRFPTTVRPARSSQ
ncbi:replication protein [Sulfurospirillum barnesii]|nr:replication protein [Sulfurospirillum barnesii]